jgi:Leucine-rich repeat (LRR) protein
MVDLSTLESLNVGKNAMTGTLDVCSKLVFLRQLVVDQNSFTGALPSLATPLLTHYIASTNHLQGTIPVSVGVLWNLQVLALDHNMALNGTLVPSQPPQLEQLTKLSILNLVQTNITGTISQALANQLKELHLSSQLSIGGSRT